MCRPHRPEAAAGLVAYSASTIGYNNNNNNTNNNNLIYKAPYKVVTTEALVCEEMSFYVSLNSW